MRTGVAHLPLHGGKAPAWLFQRMKLLAREVVLAITKEYGVEEFLFKLSDPFWFQAFGCCLGFDWHSSGLTTTVMGAIKEGLRPVSKEIGLFVAGGKGATSRKTPQEIDQVAQRRWLSADPASLIYASRMSAKVDNTALQDGYQLYQHTFVFSENGKWAVVQQGMNPATRLARRYHWLSDGLKDFVCEPHQAVCCDKQGHTLNMVARESAACRTTSTRISAENPALVTAQFEKLQLSRRHAVSLNDIRPENLKRILLQTYERQPQDFQQLLGIQGVGPKTIRALALVSELIYGQGPSFRDPVRFSFAHGGKDGHPYPVNRCVYDRSIQILREAVNQSQLERSDKLKAIKRLSRY